jgi:endonuclease YncB( thermonuclease family)
MRVFARVAFCLAVLLLPGHGGAATRAFAGIATVVDGDTIRVDGVAVRLAVIDAPERGQTCDGGGRSWPCGAAATAALERLVAGRVVTCTPNGRRSYNRVVAMCRAGGIDLSLAMAEQGLARVLPRFVAEWPDRGAALVAAEAAARAAGRGIWSGTAAMPAGWRGAP